MTLVDRRRFLQTASVASSVSLVSSCQPVQGPQNEPGELYRKVESAFAEPVLNVDGITSPVIIESIRLLKKNREFYVHVRSKDGAEGVSVTNPRASYLYPILNELVIPYFVGKDARQLEEHLFGVYRHKSNYKLQGLALWCPVAWVEFAILDMLGRIAGRSIGNLIGTVIRDEIPFYRASGRRDTTPEEEVAALQQMIAETGATAVKFRVGGRMSRNEDASPGRTEGLIRLARKTLGDEIGLLADSNSSFDPPRAIEVGRLLEEINAYYFEEPCPFDHLEDTKKVADELNIPVSGGEQEFSERRFRWMILNRAVDIVQPDIHYYGGLIRSMRVAKMAEVAGMPTTVHISGGFGFIYMLHFTSCVPQIGNYQEYKGGIEEFGPWFDPPLELRSGKITVPKGPGVGIVDPSEVVRDAEEVS